MEQPAKKASSRYPDRGFALARDLSEDGWFADVTEMFSLYELSDTDEEKTDYMERYQRKKRATWCKPPATSSPGMMTDAKHRYKAPRSFRIFGMTDATSAPPKFPVHLKSYTNGSAPAYNVAIKDDSDVPMGGSKLRRRLGAKRTSDSRVMWDLLEQCQR